MPASKRATFELKQTMNIQQIAKTLQEGRIAELNVRIPQGKRLEEIAAIVASQVPDRAPNFGIDAGRRSVEVAV